LIREFEREIKDEEGRNPPEVNKQLNDEKQSMVSTKNLSFLYALAGIVFQVL
jgi:SNARE protein